MTKAEERGLEAVPPRWRKTKDGKGKVDSAWPVRKFYIRAYEQAEKDLGWISVVDALPEYAGWYIVCNDESGKPMNIGVSYWDTTLDKWLDGYGYEYTPGYWMPIPKLPKR